MHHAAGAARSNKQQTYIQTNMTIKRTVNNALAELQASGYDAWLATDGWLVVLGPWEQERNRYEWEAWFHPNNTDWAEVGDAPQQVFDLAVWE